MQNTFRQAIVTKYVGPTNFKGSRIKATCERGSITIEWSDALNSEQNHVAARCALIAKFLKEDAARYGSNANPWGKPMIAGQIPSGAYVHVFTT